MVVTRVTQWSNDEPEASIFTALSSSPKPPPELLQLRRNKEKNLISISIVK